MAEEIPTNGAANIKTWDVAPPKDYFRELFRVSKEQIIWGGNYFDLPPTRCFIIWDKMNISERFTMSMCEYAWASFNDNAKLFRWIPQGTPGMPRIHPTQKPVELYQWIYKMYAKPQYKILDTHMGSGSSRIAAHDANLDYVGFEIDKVYFEKSKQWYEDHTSELRMEDMSLT